MSNTKTLREPRTGVMGFRERMRDRVNLLVYKDDYKRVESLLHLIAFSETSNKDALLFSSVRVASQKIAAEKRPPFIKDIIQRVGSETRRMEMVARQRKDLIGLIDDLLAKRARDSGLYKVGYPIFEAKLLGVREEASRKLHSQTKVIEGLKRIHSIANDRLKEMTRK